jgi:hypothetical protein
VGQRLPLSGKPTGEFKPTGGYGVAGRVGTHQRGDRDTSRRSYQIERSLGPGFVFLESRCSAAVIPHGKLSGMADARAQDPFAIAARPSRDDSGGRVCTSVRLVAAAVEQRLAAAEVSAVAGPGGGQASVAKGGRRRPLGRVFWRHVGL